MTTITGFRNGADSRSATDSRRTTDSRGTTGAGEVTDPGAGELVQPAGSGALRGMMTMLALDLGLPIVTYFAAEMLGASTFVSLLAGTIASGLRMVWVALRQRRLDAFATFLLVLFGAGLVLSSVTGDVRFMLAKDCATSATVGLTMVVSCLIGRPLAYYAALRFAGAAGRDRIVATTQDDAMRRRWYRVSLVWGLALLTDTSLRIAAIYLLPIHVAANVSQILMIAVYTLLFGWTIHSSRRAHA